MPGTRKGEENTKQFHAILLKNVPRMGQTDKTESSFFEPIRSACYQLFLFHYTSENMSLEAKM